MKTRLCIPTLPILAAMVLTIAVVPVACAPNEQAQQPSNGWNYAMVTTGNPPCPDGTSPCVGGGYTSCCNDASQTCKILSALGGIIQRPYCQPNACAAPKKWCNGAMSNACCDATAVCAVQSGSGICGSPMPCAAGTTACNSFCCDNTRENCYSAGSGIRYCVPKTPQSCKPGETFCDGKGADDTCCRAGTVCYQDRYMYNTCAELPPKN